MVPVEVDARRVFIQHPQPFSQLMIGTDSHARECESRNEEPSGIFIQGILNPLQVVKGLLVTVVDWISVAVPLQE